MSDLLLESIREKSGEVDLNCILHATLGGYTKKSVLEYLAALKKQQQGLKENYATELQATLSEKDTALKELEGLKSRLQSCESERQALEKELSGLKEEHGALESDMSEALSRIHEDEQTINSLKQDLEDEKRRSAQNRSTSVAGGFMLDSARVKIDGLTAQLAEREAELATLRESERVLRESQPEEKLAEMRSEIDRLLADSESLQTEISLRDEELKNRASRLETLSRQETANRKEIDQLRQKLVDQSERNEWIEAENEQLGMRLTEQMERGIVLCREISRLKASNSILQTRTGSYSGYETETLS